MSSDGSGVVLLLLQCVKRLLGSTTTSGLTARSVLELFITSLLLPNVTCSSETRRQTELKQLCFPGSNVVINGAGKHFFPTSSITCSLSKAGVLQKLGAGEDADQRH